MLPLRRPTSLNASSAALCYHCTGSSLILRMALCFRYVELLTLVMGRITSSASILPLQFAFTADLVASSIVLRCPTFAVNSRRLPFIPIARHCAYAATRYFTHFYTSATRRSVNLPRVSSKIASPSSTGRHFAFALPAIHQHFASPTVNRSAARWRRR